MTNEDDRPGQITLTLRCSECGSVARQILHAIGHSGLTYIHYGKPATCCGQEQEIVDVTEA